MERAGKYFVIIANSLLLLLWAYACVSKFIGHHIFEVQLMRSPVSQVQDVAKVVSWFIPMMEGLIATALLTENFKMLGFYCSLILLIAFESYIALAFSSGQHMPCSCGGIIAKLTWKGHLIFNGFFIMLTIAVMLIYKREMKRK